MPVGPGSVLAARYTVVGRVQQHPRWERWTARDATLERDVVLLCFPLDAPTAAAALDAARRAAGIEDSRLVRVLDVGAGPDTSFVVEEPLTGSHSVRALVEAGGLPAEEARRIAGESATALAAAATRGLHHGQLTPRDILVLPDGAVKVRGLATQAVQACTEWGLRRFGLPEVRGVVASANRASCAVLERAGFALVAEGVSLLHGQERSVRRYARPARGRSGGSGE